LFFFKVQNGTISECMARAARAPPFLYHDSVAVIACWHYCRLLIVSTISLKLLCGKSCCKATTIIRDAVVSPCLPALSPLVDCFLVLFLDAPLLAWHNMLQHHCHCAVKLPPCLHGCHCNFLGFLVTEPWQLFSLLIGNG